MTDVEYNPNGTIRSTSAHYDAVKAFTEAFNQPVGAPMDNDDLMHLREELIAEEYYEVIDELMQPQLDPAALTKELVDLLYVVYGCAVTFGLPIDEVFERVHRSNMSKLDDNGKPIYREDGKVLKGPNYKKPDLADLF